VKATRFPAILGVVLMFQACSVPPVPVTQTRDLPYARCTLTLTDHAEEATFAACFGRIGEILRDLNMYSADSGITAVNRAAGVKAVPVSADVWEVLRQGLALAAATDGRFDPTVGPLVRLWGIGGEKARVPGPEEIRSALQRIGWKDVILDNAGRTVELRRTGMALDFGALAKG
jgi:thiamine biosynthesis lipoprotein